MDQERGWNEWIYPLQSSGDVESEEAGISVDSK